MTATVKTLNEARQELLTPSQRPFIERYPFTWYRVMREQAPVFYDEELRTWMVFRYDDAQRVLTDYETFSSNTTDKLHNEGTTLIESDPPRHRQMRTLASQAFTPRRVASLAPAITGIAHSLLDRVLQRGEIDVAGDFGFPLPAIVISNLLGLPLERAPFLRNLINNEVRREVQVGEQDVNLPSFTPQFRQVFVDLIEQRRQHASEDLISALLNVEVDEERLNADEIADFCVLLFIAGHFTTANLITNTFLCFSENPEVLARVQSDFSLIPGLIEEVLRYYSPVQAFTRVVTKDATIGERQLHAGDSIAVFFGSANHDEHIFDKPERFNITRTQSKHMAFGYGIHFCLGAPLARLEGPIALQAMLERMENIQPIPNFTFKLSVPWQFFGVERMPITFTPRQAKPIGS